jgi:CHAT domain-containing protein
MFQQLSLRDQRESYCRILPVIAMLLCCASGALTQSASQAISPPGIATRDEQDPRRLEPTKSIERDLSGEQVHSYRVKLEANWYVYLTVEQKGIDVRLRLVAPNGRQVVEIDSTKLRDIETIKIIAEQSGEYILEVRAASKADAGGSYEVKIQELRPAVEQDRNRIAAHRLSLEAINLYAQRTTETRRSAVQKFQSMLPLLRAAGDHKEEGETLDLLAILHRELGESKTALGYFEQRRQLFHGLGQLSKESDVIQGICYYYKELDEYQKALDCLVDRSLPLTRSLADRQAEANTLATIGLVYSDLSEYQKSLDFNTQALLLSRANGYRGEEALARANLASTYLRLGEPQKALDNYTEALPVFRELGHPGNVAISLQNMGVAYSDMGEFQKALDSFNQVLPLFRDLGYRLGEGHTLYNSGIAYQKLGQTQKALDELHQALQIFEDLHSPRGQGRTLIYIGIANQALGESSRSTENFGQALSVFRTVTDKGGEAFALYCLARNDRAAGRLDSARQGIEKALTIVESLRSQVVSQELRASYFASVHSYYEFYIELLMRMHQQQPTSGYQAMALQVSERARARSLLELLNEASVDIRKGVAPPLLERELNLRQLLNQKAERQIRLLTSPHTKEHAGEVFKEIAALTTEYEQVRAQIRIQSPGYAALTQPQPLGVNEIQKKVLDDDTLLLEFSLGEERSYLWTITRTSLTSFELPGRLMVETIARRVYELLTARSKRIAGETIQQRRARLAQADADYAVAAATLSQMLLGAAASQLGNKRLLIVADGALLFVPFAALPAPWETPNSRTHQGQLPLVVQHEVVVLPSASALAVLRQEVGGRRPAAKAVAVLADPVFDKDDARVQTNSEGNALGSDVRLPAAKLLPEDLARAMEDVTETESLKQLPRLYNTRAEADAINSLVPARDSLQALDFAANRANATSPELSQYRIVHFATHAIANNVHPELSGIVLSLVDKLGQPQDGFLRTNELFNLKLPAELVVLSACRTGLGKEVKGEGLIGLTRGFMYAGTPRLVVSLWAVDDSSTAALMARFYKKMMTGEKQSPSAALRAAQIEMSREPAWKAPYYWAGFIFQGEWKQMGAN